MNRKAIYSFTVIVAIVSVYVWLSFGRPVSVFSGVIGSLLGVGTARADFWEVGSRRQTVVDVTLVSAIVALLWWFETDEAVFFAMAVVFGALAVEGFRVVYRRIV